MGWAYRILDPLLLLPLWISSSSVLKKSLTHENWGCLFSHPADEDFNLRGFLSTPYQSKRRSATSFFLSFSESLFHLPKSWLSTRIFRSSSRKDAVKESCLACEISWTIASDVCHLWLLGRRMFISNLLKSVLGRMLEVGLSCSSPQC